MIVPEEDEDLQYFDDDFASLSSLDTVRERGELLSEDEEAADGRVVHRTDSAITTDAFSGFRSSNDSNVVSNNNNSFMDESLRHMGAGDFNAAIPEPQNGKITLSCRLDADEPVVVGEGVVREAQPETDVFGRSTAKGRSNWFTSEYGSIFRLMDGDLLPKDFAKPARKATTDIKYIKQLYTGDVSLAELSVGEDTKRVGWGSFYKGDADAWNVWNSESELATLTTLDVQRNVAAAVNSRRRMQWAIGVERNGMVTGVELNEEQKDILRQAIDFSLSREFVPELDPRIVRLELVRVSAVTGTRWLVMITINSLVESLHQLSSGRIFYLVGDKVVMAESINQIRLALEERLKHDERLKMRGLGVKGGWKRGTWITVVGGLALSIGAMFAVKRWLK